MFTLLSVAFQTWKDDTETSNHCSFVILSGKVKNKQNEAEQYYQCNRCGQYKPNRKGKRRVKMSGTCKIERNCTSTIKATFHADGKVTADICCTHYGHEKELEHTWIPKSSRNSIGSKLQQGVRRDKILSDIRETVIDDRLHRIHLTSAQDLENLKRAFQINDIQRHVNDQESVLSWIQQWKSDPYNPVLYYKMQGEENKKKKLKTDDFIIIIQTESQKYVFQRFAKNGLCCDSTHGTTGYDFVH